MNQEGWVEAGREMLADQIDRELVTLTDGWRGDDRC